MKIIYLIWAPYNRRAESFAQGLNIDVWFIHYFHYQKMKWSVFKYPLMAVKTVFLLIKKRPDCIIVMTPPLFTVLFVYLYCLLFRKKYLIDAHTGSLISRPWTHFRWLHRFLCRNAVRTIVTNRRLAEIVHSWGGKTLVMSPPVRFPGLPAVGEGRKGKLVVVAAFSFDEPLTGILQAARQHPKIHFYVTGNKLKANSEVLAFESEHIHFTGFLPQLEYLRLLNESDGVLCLTTRDHTLQSGGEEALYLGKPLITSNFQILRDFFRKGAVHVSPNADAISGGIRLFYRDWDRLAEEIVQLRSEYESEWKVQKTQLMELLSSGEPH
jgi:glycosyltransferase involved in cell wall biosynthesis